LRESYNGDGIPVVTDAQLAFLVITLFGRHGLSTFTLVYII